MSNNHWLYNRLKATKRKVEEGCEPVVRVSYRNKQYLIYVPGPTEYVVSVDVVKKAIALGANTISYAKSWCEPSQEAKLYAKERGILLLPHAGLFAVLKIDED